MHCFPILHTILDVERSWNLLVENNGILQHVNQETYDEKNKQKYKKSQTCSLRKGIFRFRKNSLSIFNRYIQYVYICAYLFSSINFKILLFISFNCNRNVIILFDMSSCMKERDFKPNRITVILECVEVKTN